MITGDHVTTAEAVGEELGIRQGRPGIAGSDLAQMDDAQLWEAARSSNIFARVSPETKLRLVKALQRGEDGKRAEVVAMTGDGVNDAPALKGSDIGIAMGRTGTEVTKQTADVILADDNFATIVAAVEEGRGVYFNIRKTLQYLLAGNAGELLVMLFAVAWGWPSPLLPVHLLWINLITDGLPALVLAADRADGSLMKRKPRKPGESLANRPFLLGLLGTGLLTAGASLTVFGIGLLTGDLASARSDAFDTLVLSEVLRALAYQSDRLPFWRLAHRGLRALLPLWATIAGILALQAVCHEVPMLARILHLQPWDGPSLALILPVSLIPLVVLELRKVFMTPRDD
jgi:Ca2+-transporting ATPase